MNQKRTFAGLITIVAVGLSVFAVSASAAPSAKQASCKTKAGMHLYTVTHRSMTCAKAVGYVKKAAAERLNPKRPGELPNPPKGFQCSAYANSKKVQTFGSCTAKKGKGSFQWELIH